MEWHTDCIVPKSRFQLQLNSQILLLGSCFTEHIGKSLLAFRLPALVNPTGIIFHPIPLSKTLVSGIHQTHLLKDDVFNHAGIWRHFDVHSSLSHPDKNEFLQQLENAISTMHATWQKTTHVMITFGTAWGYVHKQSGHLVANNHKLPASRFDKVLTTIPEVVNAWTKILQLPEAQNKQWLFTVSPVRHLKDGFIENARSKAILLEAIHQLESIHQHVSYFPSYEIMLDDLRDYRFYEKDLVHPNATAIEYIWEKFTSACMQQDVIQWLDAYKPVLAAKQHKPFFPETIEHQQFLQYQQAFVKRLQIEYPMMHLEDDLTFFA